MAVNDVAEEASEVSTNLQSAYRGQPAPLLVVSDVDGTLIDSRERVSPGMRQAVATMTAQGTAFVIATGRPARWVLPVVEQLPVNPLCVCANGAVVYDSAADQVVRVAELLPAVMEDILVRLTSDVTSEALRDIGFAVERAGVSAFDRAEELFCVTAEYNHAWLSDEHNVMEAAELVSEPAVKLLVRSPFVSSAELYEAVVPRLDLSQVHVTYSWEGGLVEISAPGVSKRSALQWVADQLGVGAAQTVAFGDMPNDLEMLQWAGLGVAMGNGHTAVKEVADVVTATNDNDGVAAVLNEWFARGC